MILPDKATPGLDKLVATRVLGWRRPPGQSYWLLPSGDVWADVDVPTFSATGDGMLAVLRAIRRHPDEVVRLAFATHISERLAENASAVGGNRWPESVVDLDPHPVACAAVLAALEADDAIDGTTGEDPDDSGIGA